MTTTVLQVFTYLVTWTFFSLATLSTLIRIYCCQYITHTWRPDDFISVVVGVTLNGALAFWQIALNLGCGG
jgi:hypothetical protein